MEQIENIVLGPRHALRLQDLSTWHRLRAECVQCRHYGILKPDLLRRRFPDSTRIMELEKRLRCTACGNRLHNIFQFGRLARD